MTVASVRKDQYVAKGGHAPITNLLHLPAAVLDYIARFFSKATLREGNLICRFLRQSIEPVTLQKRAQMVGYEGHDRPGLEKYIHALYNEIIDYSGWGIGTYVYKKNYRIPKLDCEETLITILKTPMHVRIQYRETFAHFKYHKLAKMVSIHSEGEIRKIEDNTSTIKVTAQQFWQVALLAPALKDQCEENSSRPNTCYARLAKIIRVIGL